MLTQLQALETLLTDAVADATCEVSRIAITAGRPAAPSGEDCTAIYVFGNGVLDENQANPEACVVLSRFAIQYEIHSCYPEDWDDQYTTEAEALAAACLYELIELVWCALVDAKDTGYFCDCKFVELEPMEVQPRSGGAVSALGGVRLPFSCPAHEESPTSP
jgi:hypothetical protein